MNNPINVSPELLLQMLDESGIKYRLIHHAPLYTVADAKSIRTELDGDEGQIKNLFVKNKKGKMWLLTLHEGRKIDLKETAIYLGAGRFSFCSVDRLMAHLGVSPGAVSPLGLINDTENLVTFYIDEALLSHAVLHVHPLDNRMTVSIGTTDLLEYLKQKGHDYHILPSSLEG